MSQQLRKAAAAAAPPQHFANSNFTHHFYLQTTLTADLGHYRFHIQVLHDYYYSAAKEMLNLNSCLPQQSNLKGYNG